MNYIIATNKIWNEPVAKNLSKKTGQNFYHIKRKEDLTPSFLEKYKPRYIFFPHWSYIIPEEIFSKYECVIFHMTDLPFGRGGSPLQNLISRGIYKTKISALRCSKGVDEGPVYFKEDLSLEGRAADIYFSASNIIEKMILKIIKDEPKPISQKGKPVIFKRRKPEESNISPLDNLTQVYDYIRMLEADGYPPAFLETNNLRLEFSEADLKEEEVVAKVKIKRKQ